MTSPASPVAAAAAAAIPADSSFRKAASHIPANGSQMVNELFSYVDFLVLGGGKRLFTIKGIYITLY